MPELRQNFFTKEWVIIATERARRPEELASHTSARATRTILPSDLPILPWEREQNSTRSHAVSGQCQRGLGGASHPQQVCRAV
jgi:galactose-1-phosphate uridylyltransferase